MAEEDEIDILGDFNLDNLLSKHDTELFDCEHSNPPWLLDTTSTSWFSSQNNFNLPDEDIDLTSNIQLSETNAKISHKWSTDEKLLFEKALEIFGYNDTNIAQFIGTKTSKQVKRYITSYKKRPKNRTFTNLYNEQEINSGSDIMENDSLLIGESQIPVSIEEVIASVNTGQPTIQNTRKRKSSNEKLKNIKKITKITKHLELVTGEGLSVPLSSKEEVIKLDKSNNETDSDVDIDIGEEEDITNENLISNISDEKKNLNNNETIVDNNNKDKFINYKLQVAVTPTVTPMPPRIPADFNTKPIRLTFTTLNIPFEELILPENQITDGEKYFNYEFFEGRLTKTPERYLKIRNHILHCWQSMKPNYVTKTSVRTGLKHCGDVNSIGRIHLYLEQIGAINFGCDNVDYIRPMMKLFSLITTSSNETRKKTKPDESTHLSQSRQRHKTKLDLNGEGGYTFIHDEQGTVIGTTVVNKEKPTSSRAKRKQPIKLICCKSFSGEMKAPYLIKIHITSLLNMDWHAHTSLDEVMGLLGGRFENGTLYIEKYVPCASSTNSATHCDMCPVSQTMAFEQLQEANLSVVGWFHSHPTFSPNPSEQDLETQLNIQQWLCKSNTDDGQLKPFIGVILSPFNYYLNTTLVSDYRCLIIKQNLINGDLKTVPYKFNSQIFSTEFSVEKFMNDSKSIFETSVDNDFNFFAPYIHDHSINYLEKMIASSKIYLAQCSSLNKMTCDSIVSAIQNYCTKFKH